MAYTPETVPDSLCMYSQTWEENEEDKEGEHLSIGQGRSGRDKENAANPSIGGTQEGC